MVLKETPDNVLQVFFSVFIFVIKFSEKEGNDSLLLQFFFLLLRVLIPKDLF